MKNKYIIRHIESNSIFFKKSYLRFNNGDYCKECNQLNVNTNYSNLMKKGD